MAISKTAADLVLAAIDMMSSVVLSDFVFQVRPINSNLNYGVIIIIETAVTISVRKWKIQIRSICFVGNSELQWV
jgi:hypothetical protein